MPSGVNSEGIFVFVPSFFQPSSHVLRPNAVAFAKDHPTTIWMEAMANSNRLRGVNSSTAATLVKAQSASELTFSELTVEYIIVVNVN